ncbi:hypothetical protein GOBAR_DD11458 [Gossypium barbadense]|nr:hypothetical protein GOBAR_DD11458 [Gossypium barbadense]
MDSRDQTNTLMKKLNVALAGFFNEYKPLSHHQVEQLEKSGQSSKSSLTPKLVQALFLLKIGYAIEQLDPNAFQEEVTLQDKFDIDLSKITVDHD